MQSPLARKHLQIVLSILFLTVMSVGLAGYCLSGNYSWLEYAAAPVAFIIAVQLYQTLRWGDYYQWHRGKWKALGYALSTVSIAGLLIALMLDGFRTTLPGWCATVSACLCCLPSVGALVIGILDWNREPEPTTGWLYR